MATLIARRLLALIPILLLVTLGVFGLITLIPGDAAVELAGGINATPERVEEVRTELRLDDPFLEQYGRWLGNAARGDLGESLVSGRSVASEISDRLPITMSLVVSGVFLGACMGLAAGILAGMRPGGVVDRIVMFGTTMGLAVPNFWLAMMLVLVFAVNLEWLPAIGYTAFTESPIDWLRGIILPAFALSVALSAVLARQVRGSLSDVMASNYVKTAWAVGAGVRRVVGKHALKNASIPAITVIGFSIAGLLGGTVLIEEIFAIPGMGSYIRGAIFSSDLPVIQGVALLFVLVNVTMALIVDIAYGFVNPKVRVS